MNRPPASCGEACSSCEQVGLLAVPLQLPCAALFLLTAAVTPANIYMYTHGATMGTPPLPLAFHYVRFAAQCVLLGLLATLAKDSFFYAWGDEIE